MGDARLAVSTAFNILTHKDLLSFILEDIRKRMKLIIFKRPELSLEYLNHGVERRIGLGKKNRTEKRIGHWEEEDEEVGGSLLLLLSI